MNNDTFEWAEKTVIELDSRPSTRDGHDSLDRHDMSRLTTRNKMMGYIAASEIWIYPLRKEHTIIFADIIIKNQPHALSNLT